MNIHIRKAMGLCILAAGCLCSGLASAAKLNVPTEFSVSDFYLTTSGTMTYWVYDQYGAVVQHSISGQSMDYVSGNAYLVGQGHFQFGTDTLRVTMGILANDPPVSTSAVPIPAAAWLFGSGLIGLFGIVRHNEG